MKDRQGVLRGKCNECNECNEYVKPVEGARCDYCDHVPTQHVKIIKLGACKCGECEEYESGEKFSYTDCQYCGCKPTEHEGAEKRELWEERGRMTMNEIKEVYFISQEETTSICSYQECVRCYSTGK